MGTIRGLNEGHSAQKISILQQKMGGMADSDNEINKETFQTLLFFKKKKLNN